LTEVVLATNVGILRQIILLSWEHFLSSRMPPHSWYFCPYCFLQTS